MSVAGLSSSGDWRFGKGQASYLRKSAEIQQNTVTRLRSFTNDWFIDTGAGLPWIDLFGDKNAEKRTLREIERVVLSTPGVRIIEILRVTNVDDERAATIELSVVDIFDERFDETVSVP